MAKLSGQCLRINGFQWRIGILNHFILRKTVILPYVARNFNRLMCRNFSFIFINLSQKAKLSENRFLNSSISKCSDAPKTSFLNNFLSPTANSNMKLFKITFPDSPLLIYEQVIASFIYFVALISSNKRSITN